MNSPFRVLIFCLFVVPLVLFVGGEWGKLIYMKYFSDREYSYLDQGYTKTFFGKRHVLSIADKNDLMFHDYISLTYSQKKFLNPEY